ncbi:RidA family protein [Marivirga sp.]|uniref:RidA family protein n=1 Tax=Marivirga sp. TaxID=2018662 RepID=UPI003DA78402
MIFFILSLSSCGRELSTIDSLEVYKTRELGFSQAVIFNEVVYGSGQVGWDKEYQLPEEQSFANQFDKTLQNIALILQDQGCDWQDVLHLRFYVVNIDISKTRDIGNFLKATYPKHYAPATTLLGVSALARENLLIEIEFTAKIKKK